MVVEGSLNLYEMTEMTGFGNYTHIPEIFEKYFRMSPKNYK